MNRTIATTLSFALLCSSAAWAEDQAAAGAAAQTDQNAAASDANKPDQSSQDKSSQDSQTSGATAAKADAAAGQEQAQAAAGREGGEQDPTKTFWQEMYSVNQFEIKASELAAQRAQDDQVKQFARMVAQDHQKANQQIKQIAQSANVQLEEQLDPVCQAKLQKIQRIPAADFGRKYINGQVAGHMMTVLELRYQSRNAQDANIKEFATAQLPEMQKHLQLATQIATKQAGGEARTAGERQSGSTRDAAGTTGDADTNAAERGAGTSGESDKAGTSDGAGAAPKDE